MEEIKEKLEQAQAAGDEREINNLKNELEEADDQLKSANDEIAELNKQLQEKPIDVPATIEVIPPEIEAELADLRSKNKSAAELKFKLQFDVLTKNFNELLTGLDEIEPESKEKYRSAVLTLITKMAGYIK